MTLKQIKQRLSEYKDLYGWDLLCSDDIMSAKTKEELRHIISRHRIFLGDILNDANNDLDDLEKETGLL